MKSSQTDEAEEDYKYWVKHNQKIARKINRLIAEIEKDPFHGIGKPEPLSGDYAGQWGRRITKMHRITYFVEADTIIITRMRDHYPKK